MVLVHLLQVDISVHDGLNKHFGKSQFTGYCGKETIIKGCKQPFQFLVISGVPFDRINEDICIQVDAMPYKYL